MKQALSLFLALVLALSMATVAFAVQIDFNDSKVLGTGFSDLTWVNGDLYHGSGSSISLGTVNPGYEIFAKIPGNGAFMPDSDAYTASLTASPAITWTGYSADEIVKSNLGVRLRVTEGPAAVVEDFGYIIDGISKEAVVFVSFVDVFPQSGTADIPFKLEAWPTIGGRTLTTQQGVTITGTLKNDGSYVAPTSSSSSSSSGSNSNRNTYTPPNNTPAPISQATAVQNVRDAVAAAGNSVNGAAVRLKNVSEVSLSTLKEMAKAAGNTGLKVNADNLNTDGSVDVRITVDPSKATSAMNLSASTTSSQAQNTQAKFAKHFNNTISTVSLSQKGSFGMPVRVAAKVDTKLNLNTLVFYAYDSAKNTYTKIENPQYKVDKNGYVHFTTSVGGEIIISDKPLKKK